MTAAEVEVLKRELTDQYVTVDSDRPELARFRGLTGRVKTVNMNGRALVEFDGYVKNIGWYDIAPSFLQITRAPAGARAAAPNPVQAKPKSKPAAPSKPAKGLSPLELARQQGAQGSAKQQPAPTVEAKVEAVGAPCATAAPAATRYVTPPPPATMKNQPPRVLNRKNLSAADILELSQGRLPAPPLPAPGGSIPPAGATTPDDPVREPPVANSDQPANASHAEKPAIPPSRGNNSTADILAACRAKKQP